jgi:hypothetical protein
MIKFTMSDKSSSNKRSAIASSGGYYKKETQPQRYATGQTAHTPVTKNAQYAGSNANVIWTQPMFFSPLHTPQNWQIASKRKEQYQWSFIDDISVSPCYVTTYDGSLKRIKDFVCDSIKDQTDPTFSYIRSLDPKDAGFIQDGHGNISYPDKVSRRKVKKKANKIKALGILDTLSVTGDHNCIVIKKEDIQCKKSKWNKKKCIYNHFAPTCKKHNCMECYDKEYKISKIKAKNIEKGDQILVPFNTDIETSIITNEDEARYAGHLASDGGICGYGDNESQYKVAGFSMNVGEIDYVTPCINNVYESLTNGQFGKIKLKKHSSQLVTTRTSSKTICDFASQLVTGKSSDKKFTSQVTLLNPKLQLHVIGAYIQSDGTYNKANSCVAITTYSPHLANQLMMMCCRCNILARINKQPISQSKGTCDTKNEFRYIVNISSSDLPKIAEYVPGKLSDINIKKRKDNRRFFWKNFVVSPVVSNE